MLRKRRDRLRRQDHLERMGLGRSREDVVRLHGLREREPVRRERLGSIRRDSISFISCGVVNVSTRPVVIVTSRIQSFSRCNVAECPWTPTFATRPPGRTISAQSSNVSGTPTASMATSTPRPSVSSMHACDGVLDAVVDRHVCAELSGLREPSVGEVDRDHAAGREQLCRHDRGETDRASADDRDGVAGLYAAVQHADLERGRKDVGEEDHVLGRQAGRELVHRRVGEWHAGELGLQARRSCGRRSSRRRRCRDRSGPPCRSGSDRTR